MHSPLALILLLIVHTATLETAQRQRRLASREIADLGLVRAPHEVADIPGAVSDTNAKRFHCSTFGLLRPAFCPMRYNTLFGRFAARARLVNLGQTFVRPSHGLGRREAEEDRGGALAGRGLANEVNKPRKMHCNLSAHL